MDEVNIQPIDLGQELGETIELRLESAPVVLSLPVVDKRFSILQADTLRPVGDGFRIRPSSSGQSLLQVLNLGVRDRDGEWADEG
jgi:hypothetical protein